MVLSQEVVVTRALHDDSISLAGHGSRLKATTFSTNSNQQNNQKRPPNRALHRLVFGVATSGEEMKE
jgi:hypothetical protein